MSALLGAPLVVMGVAAALSSARLVVRRVRLRGRFSPAVIVAVGTVSSPLNGARCVYCRWSITQRHLGRGVSEGLSGEVSAPFEVAFVGPQSSAPLEGSHAVSLERAHLLLEPAREEAWTVDEGGLSPAARAEVLHGLAPDRPGTRYHLEHMLLVDGQAVWFDAASGSLADAPPESLARGLTRGVTLLGGLGVLLGLAGIAAW